MSEPDLLELVRLIKISMTTAPNWSIYDLDSEMHWRIAMPRIMSATEATFIARSLGLVVGQYVFCSNTDNNGKTQVIKIYVVPQK